MELDQNYFKLQLLGEEILRKNGEKTGSFAKTNPLSFANNLQFLGDSRNPEFPALLRNSENAEMSDTPRHYWVSKVFYCS